MPLGNFSFSLRRPRIFSDRRTYGQNEHKTIHILILTTKTTKKLIKISFYVENHFIQAFHHGAWVRVDLCVCSYCWFIIRIHAIFNGYLLFWWAFNSLVDIFHNERNVLSTWKLALEMKLVFLFHLVFSSLRSMFVLHFIRCSLIHS